MFLDFQNKLSNDEIIAKSEDVSQKLNICDGSNILIKGDNFIALSSLINDYKGKIDLVYIDPPFNTEQDFSVSDGRANTISRCKQQSKVAYSDKKAKDDYLEFLRERIVLIHELLSEEGSLYLHIDYKIGHYVKIILDEIFGEDNFKNDITRIKSNPKNFSRRAYGNEKDMVLFYVKNYKKNIWNDVRISLDEDEIEKSFSKIDKNGRRYTTIPLHAPGETANGATSQSWRGIKVPAGRHWRTSPKEFDELDKIGLIEWSSNGNPRIKKYADEHKGKKIQDIWKYKDPQYPIYPTEKNIDMLKMIIQQSSNENSIVLDCFAGSGATLLAANTLNRRWIGVDNSNVSIDTVTKRMNNQFQRIDIK